MAMKAGTSWWLTLTKHSGLTLDGLFRKIGSTFTHCFDETEDSICVYMPIGVSQKDFLNVLQTLKPEGAWVVTISPGKKAPQWLPREFSSQAVPPITTDNPYQSMISKLNAAAATLENEIKGFGFFKDSRKRPKMEGLQELSLLLSDPKNSIEEIQNKIKALKENPDFLKGFFSTRTAKLISEIEMTITSPSSSAQSKP